MAKKKREDIPDSPFLWCSQGRGRAGVMVMSETDICLEYNQAKAPSLQVEILADMNLCSKEDIMGVLIRNGTDMSKAVNHRSRRNSAILSQVMTAELEAADAAVRAAVKRYEQVLQSIEKTGGKQKKQ